MISAKIVINTTKQNTTLNLHHVDNLENDVLCNILIRSPKATRKKIPDRARRTIPIAAVSISINKAMPTEPNISEMTNIMVIAVHSPYFVTIDPIYY